MINNHLLLAHFWTNANQLITPTGIEIDLHNDSLIVLSVTIRNEANYPQRLQLKAEFSLQGFITQLELEQLADIQEISIEVMFTLLAMGKAGYSVFEV
jgi:predicted house-cleaning noncanonical NTP pyrophosphatase (MazG superfamily)